MFDVGGGELIVVLLVVLLLFGPKKIPEFAQMVGKGLRKFRMAQEELTQQIRDISAEAAIHENHIGKSPTVPKPIDVTTPINVSSPIDVPSQSVAPNHGDVTSGPDEFGFSPHNVVDNPNRVVNNPDNAVNNLDNVVNNPDDVVGIPARVVLRPDDDAVPRQGSPS